MQKVLDSDLWASLVTGFQTAGGMKDLRLRFGELVQIDCTGVGGPMV